MRAVALFLGIMWLLAGCATAPVAPAAPAAVSQPEVVAAPATAEVWGEAPTQCSCHVEPLVRITTDLQELPVTFQLENAIEGWHVFSVKFDPTQVSIERVQAILKDDGALVIPAPL